MMAYVASLDRSSLNNPSPYQMTVTLTQQGEQAWPFRELPAPEPSIQQYNFQTTQPERGLKRRRNYITLSEILEDDGKKTHNPDQVWHFRELPAPEPSIQQYNFQTNQPARELKRKRTCFTPSEIMGKPSKPSLHDEEAIDLINGKVPRKESPQPEQVIFKFSESTAPALNDREIPRGLTFEQFDSQYIQSQEQPELRNTPSLLGWNSTELLTRYDFVVLGKEPFFRLLKEWEPTSETPARVYLDQPE
jgi:hypothetical protein